ncbi:MAG: SpoIIE family protein phosphatase, partial [Desulfobulbaceae bacterium]|nr:SpoIIE family protein phosphatase [Desulfobulbaceae bacterium]
SGHAVNCVLRSIITDLFYNAMVFDKEARELSEIVGRLNQTLCSSGLFQEDEFCTGVMAELDHKSLMLTYVSAGHPPILLLRGDTVIPLPGPDQDGRNLPLGFMGEVDFTSGRFQLRSGDRLLFLSDGLQQLAETPDAPPLSLQELVEHLRALLVEAPAQRISRLLPALLCSILGSMEQVAALLEHNASGDDFSLIALEIEAKRYQGECQVKPCDFADIDSMLRHVLERIARDLQASEFVNVERGLALVLSEAVLNAWKHGNRQNPTTPIRLRWRFANDFTLEVIDAGEGFNSRELPNPLASCNKLAASGRGIFIIRKFTDAVAWFDGGRRVVMTWRHPQALGVLSSTPGSLLLGRDLWLDV